MNRTDMTNLRKPNNLNVDWRSQIPALRKAQTMGRFAEFRRKPKTLEPVAGYLIELSRDCLVLRELHWDTFTWNGACMIKTKDLGEVRLFEEHEWPIIAGREMGLLSKTSLRVSSTTFLELAKDHLHEGDLVQIEMEKINPGDMFLCEILHLSRNGLHAKSHDRTLHSFEETNIPYREITKVTFGDGYSKAAKLALTAKRTGLA